MEKLGIWVQWFFHNTEVIGTALLLIILVVPMALQVKLTKLADVAAVIACCLIVAILFTGVYNLVTAPRCDGCGCILAVDSPFSRCDDCNMQVARLGRKWPIIRPFRN